MKSIGGTKTESTACVSLASAVLLIGIVSCLVPIRAQAIERPNVIMIATDDLNTWVGPLGSSIEAKTPNLDRLARMGVTFTNAHTAGIYCAPSRSAIFTGRYASTTGCYNTELYFFDHPDYRPLQLTFQEGGYRTFGTGKLFHHSAGHVDLRGWDQFFVRNARQKTQGWPMDSWKYDAPLPDPYPHSPYNQRNEKWKGKPFMEVGPVPNDTEERMADTQRANWACQVLKQRHDRPFFLALGFYAPHFPNYAPQKYFDLYPLNTIERPAWKEDDLDDIPEIVRKKHESRKRNIHHALLELGIVETTLQGYLACISYADAMVGRVLDALEASPYRHNTIVLFWSDHGYTHGQKGHWGKHSLWEPTSHVPLMWAGPGVARDQRTDVTVSLVDIYPTLVERCGLQTDTGLEGSSLAATLRQPDKAEDRSVLLPYDEPDSYAVINRDWRYIHYRDSSEELYDLSDDPHEWTNLAGDRRYLSTKNRLRAQAPARFAPRGTPKNKLRMVVEGDSFQWISRE